ncbi:potassium/proton antiporter [bacterium]|nr:potassium/proton antiporter [bacterium]
MTIESILLWVAVLLFVSVISSRISDRFAIPVLLLFLGIGMLSGSEGIGGIPFDNASLAKSIGLVSLIFIIFSGGMDTEWEDTKPIVWHGVVLSTFGVLITAVITGFFAVYILDFSIWEGMLLGSIVSSTDAAVVFAVLRSRRVSLKKPMKPLLEFESGSNDPMAIFLTTGCISLLTIKNSVPYSLFPRFLLDMGMGALTGYLMSKAIVFTVKKIKLDYEGLYPVVTISLVLFTYCIAVLMKGNGILAVYLAGLGMGQKSFPHKKYINKFHDVLSWICQIAMFVTLGMLVFPSHLLPLAGAGLLLTFLLMFVARPISVFLCLQPFKTSRREKTLISWVGLRGSVPIILATFPFTAGVPHADVYFNIVFFVVIISVFVQGASIPFVAKLLKLDAPLIEKKSYPIEFEKIEGMAAKLVDIVVPYDSQIVGKKIEEFCSLHKCIIVLISRGDKYLMPFPAVVLEEGDVLLVLANQEDIKQLQSVVKKSRTA